MKTYEETYPWHSGSHVPAKRCYESHPPLTISGHKVYGGNCGHPVVLDADIYVALQAGSYVRVPYPWEKKKREITQVMYTIPDMGVPSSPSSFKQMIEWLCNQLQEGRKIHIGCIGGHGRTGMVLAAMVRHLMPEVEDAITYVRQNYCKKAVESSEQVDFLVEHFGAKSVSATKGDISWGSKGSGSRKKYVPPSNVAKAPAPSSARFKDSKKSFDPVPSARNLFLVEK